MLKKSITIYAEKPPTKSLEIGKNFMDYCIVCCHQFLPNQLHCKIIASNNFVNDFVKNPRPSQTHLCPCRSRAWPQVDTNPASQLEKKIKAIPLKFWICSVTRKEKHIDKLFPDTQTNIRVFILLLTWNRISVSGYLQISNLDKPQPPRIARISIPVISSSHLIKLYLNQHQNEDNSKPVCLHKI